MLYAFFHNTRVVWFGPYENEREAKLAFQWKYGYWPSDTIESKVYDASVL